MLAGLGLVVAGCTETTDSQLTRPDVAWPTLYVPKPREPKVAATLPPKPAPRPAARPAASRQQAILPGVAVMSRENWTDAQPITPKVNPLRGAYRITIHHEGWTPVWFSDAKSTASRLEQIRKVHVRDRKWGDIGYHFIVDRAGRVWQGRDLKYQGAHVRNNNEHNIGILVLGNFEKQRPTQSQTAALVKTVNQLLRTHNIRRSRVMTHREIMPTACPGKNLQTAVVALRKAGRFA